MNPNQDPIPYPYHMLRHSPVRGALVITIVEKYLAEGVPMPVTLDDLYREFLKSHGPALLQHLSPEERIAGIPTEELDRLLQQRRAADAAAGRRKKNDKSGQIAAKPKRRSG